MASTWVLRGRFAIEAQSYKCKWATRLQAPPSARGFRITVHKWLVLVRLLLGEIPERTGMQGPTSC